MRNLGTIIILIIILYGVFQDRKADIFKTTSPKITENSQIKAENSDKIKSNLPKEEALTQEQEKPRKYEYQPSNVIERMITNAMSDFVQSPTGFEVAKNMLEPMDLGLRNSSLAFSTNGFSAIKRKYTIEQMVKSTGKRTICGQQIKLQYIVSDKKDKQIESKIVEYILGEHPIIELNEIPTGLALNEIVTGKYLSKDNASFEYANKGNKITLAVLKHLSETNFDLSKVKIFDDYVSTARAVTCADDVKFYYKIMNIDGSLIKEGEMRFVVGDYNYPQVMTYILDTMQLLGTRTVLMPEKYLTLSKTHPILEHSSENYVMIELSKAFIFPKNIAEPQ